MRRRILIVARDIALRGRLARLLKTAGHAVELAESAAHARRIGLKGFALVIVLPDGLGSDVRSLRAELEAQGAKAVMVGMGPGSLDPSDELGLLARIAEAMRPASIAEPTQSILRFGGFRLDLAGHTVIDQAGNDISLTRGEFSLLREFVQRPGRVLSRDQLQQAISGRDAEAFDRNIDMLMVRLRRKIEPDPKRPSLIVTVPGSGYKFTAKVTTETGAEPGVVGAEPSAALPKASASTNPERRQLTIMQCALAGPAFTAARRDPEDLQRLLAVFREPSHAVIAEAGGTIDWLLNDGLLAYFGYPQADEHQAERAIRAGLKLVEAVGRIDTGGLGSLQARIGVATGLALVGGRSAGEPAALGEVAHLATGLAYRAEPDAVVISAATRRLVGELFELRGPEPIASEEGGEPTEVWQVIAETTAKSRFEALRGAQFTQLVGREEELELLLRRWNQARAGTGKVVLISGEPGIGKSRLVHAFRDAIAEQPHVELRLFCSPLHQDIALHPSIAQLKHAAGFTRHDTDETRLMKLNELLTRSNATDEAVGLLAELLSIPSNQRARIKQMSPQAQRDRMLSALLTQLTELARAKPVLVIYEDVHWIDPTSHELLDRIIEQVEHQPALLVVTLRPEFQPPWIGHSFVTTLALNRLSRRDTTVMIGKVAGRRIIHPEIVKEIADRSDRVPLFIEEVTKSVLEAGADLSEALQSVQYSSLFLPATLQGFLVTRLDRLGYAAKNAAQKGAALGREFTYDLIAAIAERSEPELRRTLDLLTGSGLLLGRGTPPEAAYKFKHALVQQAVYSTIPRFARRQLHERIVAVLETQFPDMVQAEPGRLAQHCKEAGLTEKAIGYWLAAGQQASARSMMAEAATLLSNGLALLPALPDRAKSQQWELDLQIAFGKTLMAGQGYSSRKLHEVLIRAHRLCNELNRRDKLLPVLWGQAIHHLIRGDLRTSQRHAGEIQQLGEELGNPPARMMGFRMSGFIDLYLGDFAAARVQLENGLSLSEAAQQSSYVEIAPSDPTASILSALAQTLVISGYLESGQSRLTAAVARARHLGHPYTLAFVLGLSLVTAWSARSEPSALLKYTEEILALSDTYGFPFFRAPALVCRCWCMAVLGEAEQGARLVDNGSAELQGTEYAYLMPGVLLLLAEISRIAGQPKTALTYLDEAERFAHSTGAKWALAETLRLRGCLLEQVAETAAAEVHFQLGIKLARHQGAKLFELRASTSLARFWRDQGNIPDAHDLLAPIYSWFTEGFDTPDLREAKALLDELGAAL